MHVQEVSLQEHRKELHSTTSQLCAETEAKYKHMVHASKSRPLQGTQEMIQWAKYSSCKCDELSSDI